MEEHAARFTAFLTANAVWAGPAVGLLSFGESLAIIGFFIPATAILLGVGGLIGAGTLPFLPVLLFAIGGAIAGDWVSYWIGRRFGPASYYRWPLNKHRQSVARARLFFRRYGMAAVFFGRFLGPLRSVVPLVAGVMNMKKMSFQIANLASAVIWVPLMFTPGYLAARNMGPATQLTEWHLVGFAAGVLLLTALGGMVGTRLLTRPRERARHQG